MTIISFASYHISLPYATCAPPPVCMDKPSFGDLNLVWPSSGAWGINQNQTTLCPPGYLATDASKRATYICKASGWFNYTSCQKGKVSWIYRRSMKINRICKSAHNCHVVCTVGNSSSLQAFSWGVTHLVFSKLIHLFIRTNIKPPLSEFICKSDNYSICIIARLYDLLQ